MTTDDPGGKGVSVLEEDDGAAIDVVELEWIEGIEEVEEIEVVEQSTGTPFFASKQRVVCEDDWDVVMVVVLVTVLFVVVTLVTFGGAGVDIDVCPTE